MLQRVQARLGPTNELHSLLRRRAYASVAPHASQHPFHQQERLHILELDSRHDQRDTDLQSRHGPGKSRVLPRKAGVERLGLVAGRIGTDLFPILVGRSVDSSHKP